MSNHVRAYVVEDASANKPDADSMPTSAKNTAVDNVKKTHHRQSSLSNFRNHSLLPPNQGLCHTLILCTVAVFKKPFNIVHSRGRTFMYSCVNGDFSHA